MSQSTTHRFLHGYAVLTAWATFILLIVGGLVTSTDSGLSVPDWPLSYGMWFPPMVGGVFYEHGHRMIAGAVGLMVLALALWLRRAEPRRWVRVLGYSALGAVIVQALLGGFTVLLLLPPMVSIAHACLGQGVFCLMVALARATSPRWVEHPFRWDDRGKPPLRALSVGVSHCALLQLILGAVIRHTGFAVVPHLIVAGLLCVLIGWLVRRAISIPHTPTPNTQLQNASIGVVWGHVWRLLGLVSVQVALGLVVLTHRGLILVRTAHVATGALVLAQAVVLAWEVARRTAPVGAVRVPEVASA